METANLTTARKIWIIVYGLLAAAAAVIAVPVVAFLLALAFTLVNQATGWFELGETQAWLGVILTLYGLYADVVIGPFVWWRVCAKRFGLSRMANNIGTAAVVSLFSVICLWVLHGEQAITNSPHLEDVSDDGRFVIARSMLKNASVLYKIDTSTGAATRLTATPRGYEGSAAFSPDGRRVVFTYGKDVQNHTMMVIDLDGKNLHPLLQEGGNDDWPRFLRDGKAVYFVRTSTTPNSAGLDIFSTSLDGREVTQLTHQHFSSELGPYLDCAPALSSDGKLLLLSFVPGESLLLYSLSNPDQQPEEVLFQLPNSPPSRQYVSAYFSPDDRGIVFMAATRGKGDAYSYDAYRVDLNSRRLDKLTENNGYASDFRLSSGGSKAVFLTWKFSRFQKLPRSYQMHLMDVRTGTVTPVSFDNLPREE